MPFKNSTAPGGLVGRLWGEKKKMDISAEKKELLDIYESEQKSLFKEANRKQKLFVYILPYALIIISLLLLICGIINKKDILLLISLFILFISFYYSYKSYECYTEKYYLKKQDANTHYRNFIKNLDKKNIKQQEQIDYYIDLLMLSNEPVYGAKTGIFEYATLIYIPFLMVHFSKYFEKFDAMILFTLGLFIVPLFVFIFKSIFRHKKNKFDLILKYLKRRSIELKYGKDDE
ncbi:MAG: hypothetical protein FWB95_04430 [Treponema sp.]|nr:hypothetical protein [Treponema sp.]